MRADPRQPPLPGCRLSCLLLLRVRMRGADRCAGLGTEGRTFILLYLCNQRDMRMLFFSFSVAWGSEAGLGGSGPRGEVQSLTPLGFPAPDALFSPLNWSAPQILPSPQGDLNIARARRTELIFAFSWMQTPETGVGLGNKGPLAASQGPLVPPLPVGLGVHGPEPLPLLPYDRGLLLVPEPGPSSQRAAGLASPPAGGARPAVSRAVWCPPGLMPRAGWEGQPGIRTKGLTMPSVGATPMFTGAPGPHRLSERLPPAPTPFRWETGLLGPCAQNSVLLLCLMPGTGNFCILLLCLQVRIENILSLCLQLELFTLCLQFRMFPPPLFTSGR
ncbi:PREDICTED: collagen alpha-2(I) chain-like [Myotis davidii]|uniref:collagen alpha-2(I) chain-like n=1 Tax=Myotis davidii TaxID=225400 RepID=UPI000767852C|nr:PREDICTED: collagen alpha-2(I) chain-like [Myotis davidii]